MASQDSQSAWDKLGSKDVVSREERDMLTGADLAQRQGQKVTIGNRQAVGLMGQAVGKCVQLDRNFGAILPSPMARGFVYGTVGGSAAVGLLASAIGFAIKLAIGGGVIAGGAYMYNKHVRPALKGPGPQ